MKKSMKLAVAGLAAMTVVGGTFAYWNATASIDNEFSTQAFDGEMTETFNPVAAGNWQPGQEVEKVVGVSNTGGYPIMARIKFEEVWTLSDDSLVTMAPQTNGYNNFFPATADSSITDDGSRVYKELLGLSTDWTWDEESGYFVSRVINPGEENVKLLNSVTLLPGAGNADYEDEKTSVSVSGVKEGEFLAGAMATVTDPATKAVKAVITYETALTESDLSDELKVNNKVTLDGNTLTIEDPEITITQKVDRPLKDGSYANASYILKITTQLAQINPETNQPMWPENN